jgi:RNA polymerase sigma-70 factor (ECF subfamily)
MPFGADLVRTGTAPANIGYIDAALTAWTVQQALASLTPEHRAVLGEVYLRGRSVRDAAVALGVTEALVKSRTYYALRALRLALEELGVSPAATGGVP